MACIKTTIDFICTNPVRWQMIVCVREATVFINWHYWFWIRDKRNIFKSTHGEKYKFVFQKSFASDQPVDVSRLIWINTIMHNILTRICKKYMFGVDLDETGTLWIYRLCWFYSVYLFAWIGLFSSGLIHAPSINANMFSLVALTLCIVEKWAVPWENQQCDLCLK